MSLGLFNVLAMAGRSMQTQQTGIEVTGNNLANVNTTGYARQRLDISTSISVPTAVGVQGTGSEATRIEQIRSQLVDDQIRSENSLLAYWSNQQQMLQFAQADLGQQISSTATSTSTMSQGIAGGLADFFSELQNLSTQPSSLSERQVLLSKANTLAGQFNQIAQELDDLRAQINNSLVTDASNANQLLSQIAGLNEQVVNAEINTGEPANDLRDARQRAIEELAQLVNVTTSAQPDGSINISIGGALLVNGKDVQDTLQTYTNSSGQVLVRTTTSGTSLTLASGSMAGKIDVRDGALADLSTNLDTLANQLIASINTVHRSGFSLTGSTGANFFSGNNAHTIAVNQSLVDDPSLIQASGTLGASGDNATALAMAQLAYRTNAGLNDLTFAQSYDGTVSALGQALATVNNQVNDQTTVSQMLQQQRSSISGVNLDEEMANLSAYQHAYEASAHLMSVVDQMLETLISVV